MRIGLNHVPKHQTPDEWACILREKGYRAASFPVNHTAPAALIDRYIKAAEEADILIAEVGVWNSPHNPDPKRAANARAFCEEQLRLAEYVGARCCVNVSGAAGSLWCGCYRENFSRRLYEENVRFIQDLCDRVNPVRTCYTLEPMQWMLPDSPEQYLAFLKDVDRPGFAVHMDLTNLVKDPYTYTHKKELTDETFRLLGSRIKSCHLKDCILEDGLTVAIREVPLGEGEMNISYYLGKIKELDEDMPVLLEHLPDMAAYDRAMEHLKSLEII